MDDEVLELDDEDEVLEVVLEEDGDDDSLLPELPEPPELLESPEPELPDDPFEDDAGVGEPDDDRLSVR